MELVLKYLIIVLTLSVLAGCGSNPRPEVPGAVISVAGRSVLDSEVPALSRSTGEIPQR